MTEPNPHNRAHRLAELLEQVADLPPSRRAHTLLASCPHDQPLREEALALAALLDGAGTFLEAQTRTHTPANNLTGKAVGPYLVNRRIGEGGMGTVYEALDTRLQRTVAVKTLSSAIGDHTAVAARLSRGSPCARQLNHPGIAAIYGIEPCHSAPGGVVLVLEYAPGITLAQRLKQGPVSRDQTLRIAAAIAEALEAAHARGIIHRDLKPSNIMLDAATGEVTVKVLDFGLAKAIHGLTLSSDPLTPPTATLATPTPLAPLSPSSGWMSNRAKELTPVDMTAAGEIMGTAAYMSPEQARAAAVDRRTDIWALGCIIFEMLVGRRLFDRGSSTATLAAVLAEPPPLSALPERLPATLTLLLNRCLRKDPKDRLRDAGDVRVMLLEAIEELNALTVKPPVTRLRPFMHGAIAVLAAGAGFALAMALLPRAVKAPGAKVPLTFEVMMSPTPIPLDESNPIALSPDGRLVVAAVGEYESARLTLRRLNESLASDIPGTEHGGSPFFSPDGQWIGFVDTDTGALRKVGRDGGPGVTLGTISANALSPVWLADDRILFSIRWNAGLHAWSPRTKSAELLAFTPPFDAQIVRPSALLPDGITVLATICSTSTSARQVEALNTNTLQRALIVENASDPFLIGPGELAFVRNDTLLSAPFDPVRLTLTGPESPITAGFTRVEGGGGSAIRGIPNGTIAFAPAASTPDTTLAWIGPDGTISPLLHGANTVGQVRISPDGTKVAITQFSNTNNLHILDLTHNASVAQRVSDALYVTRFAWSPDSKRLAFNASPAATSGVGPARDVPAGIFTIAADGNSPATLLRRFPPGDLRVYDWSPDGRYIAVATVGEEAKPTDPLDTFLVDVDHPEALKPVLTTVAGEFGSVFSHDGRWIAYTHELHETQNVYIAPFPACTPVVRVSTQGGYRPRWSHDDKTIYFLNASDFFAVPVDITSSEPRIGQPRILHSGLFSDQFDVAADGRVLASMRRQAPNTTLRIMTGIQR